MSDKPKTTPPNTPDPADVPGQGSGHTLDAVTRPIVQAEGKDPWASMGGLADDLGRQVTAENRVAVAWSRLPPPHCSNIDQVGIMATLSVDPVLHAAGVLCCGLNSATNTVYFTKNVPDPAPATESE